MILEEILKTVHICQSAGDLQKDIKGLEMDSRQIKPEYLFVAVKGTQTDGHTYIDKAIASGATAIVCEDLPENLLEQVTYIQVPDSEEAVGKLATTFYGDPTSKLDLVGVTGTNGKPPLLLYYIICSVTLDIKWDLSLRYVTISTEWPSQPTIPLPTPLPSTAYWDKWQTRDANMPSWK